MPLDTVPTYALYGEAAEKAREQWLHCESIATRSALYDWQIKAHRHQHFFQFLHIGRGAADIFLGGRWTAAPIPAAVTLPPQVVHGFRFAREVEGHVVTVPIEHVERLLEANPRARDWAVRPRVLPLGGHAEASRIAAEVAALAAEFAGHAAWRSPLIEAHLSAILLLVARLAAADTARESGGSPLGRHADAFRALVDRHYRRRLPVAYYAAQLGTSQTHLNRICRAAFQDSALGVIDRRVVLEATRDLTFTVLSVKEIAGSLGFDDPAYFSRFFAKHVGVSPARFRQRQAAPHPPRRERPR
ncbi:MAG TPA: helix-turn-helix domain-containing protein [Alphaproteobacteria bacterium]|nr:helix-turn-helix domain-containing protein [Alphaproteobacteria bacterium]